MIIVGPLLNKLINKAMHRSVHRLGRSLHFEKKVGREKKRAIAFGGNENHRREEASNGVISLASGVVGKLLRPSDVIM
jgi:hypothetical protein